jgi:hypothetical protein
MTGHELRNRTAVNAPVGQLSYNWCCDRFNASSLAPHSNLGEMTMNAKIRMLMTLVAVVFALALLPLEQATSARSTKSAQSENSNCKQVKGNLTVNFSPGTASGEVTNGSVLNGTFATVFNAGSVAPTADPTSVTFTGGSTITTDKGVLVTRDVYLFDFVMALGPGMLRIDSAASTGDFAGATGILYINPNFGDAPGHGELAGKICFANQ